MKNDIKVEFIAPEHWYNRAKWKLLESYTSHNNAITVPAGFVTDGATIPLLLRGVFSPTGKYFGAAIVHDYVIVVGKDWDKANDEFNKEMKALGISDLRRRVMVFAVRTWHKIKKLFNRA